MVYFISSSPAATPTTTSTATDFRRRVFLLLMLVAAFQIGLIKSDPTDATDANTPDITCDIEIENTLRTLLAPQDNPSMQVQSLRKHILRRFQEALDKVDDPNYKRRLNARLFPTSGSSRGGGSSNNYPSKRNLEALARAGYIHTLLQHPQLMHTLSTTEEADDYDYNKRGVANLAKNGQFPVNVGLPHYVAALDYHQQKRGIESLARNGDLHHLLHRNQREILQDLIDELYDDSNNQRDNNMSPPGLYAPKRFLGFGGKRNVAALARDGSKINGKRNVAALLRQDSYLNNGDGNISAKTETPAPDEEKRNLASIKASGSRKYKRSIGTDHRIKRREADFYEDDEEYSAPGYQNQNGYDYEEMMKAFTKDYPSVNKRFLGRLPQMGKSKTTPSPKKVRFRY